MWDHGNNSDHRAIRGNNFIVCTSLESSFEVELKIFDSSQPVWYLVNL